MTYLERVDWPEGVQPPCPICRALTAGLREVEAAARGAGNRPDHVPILVLAAPCGCEVTEQAALLQHDAILLEHDLAEGRPTRPTELVSSGASAADPASVPRCASEEEPHQVHPIQLVLALLELRGRPEIAVCTRCQTPVDLTERVRVQEAHRG